MGATMTLNEINNKLKSTLKPQRYRHSVSVAETAKELAVLYGADEEKAYFAGLVHDCAKNYSREELFELSLKYSIELDDISKTSWGLIHGYVGAELAKHEYGICDKDIYDAIYYHTIGKADMPLLTEIIYLADGIEPMRNYAGVDEIRMVSQTNLYKALVMYTDATIKYVLKRGFLLHPAAIETRNFYLDKLSNTVDKQAEQ